MDRVTFAFFMESIHKRFNEAEEFYNKVGDIFGCSASGEMIQYSFFTNLLEAISLNFDNPDAVYEEIEFIVFDCDWDFSKYEDRVKIDGENVVINSWGDFYDIISTL